MTEDADNVRFMGRRDAAEYCTSKGLALAVATLEKFATIGGGPKFRKWGRKVVYAVPDLDAWIAQRLGPAVSSTSELAA